MYSQLLLCSWARQGTARRPTRTPRGGDSRHRTRPAAPGAHDAGPGLACEEAFGEAIHAFTLPGGVGPERVELAAQPRPLALGELAGGGDGAFAERRRVGRAVEVVPGLAIADGADRGQVAYVLAGLRALPALQAREDVRDLPAIRAVGYRQAWDHLDGATDAATFRERAIAATRQLAKRQWTWLRGELDALWFDPATDAARMAGVVDGFLR